jgi:hypothetical protein
MASYVKFIDKQISIITKSLRKTKMSNKVENTIIGTVTVCLVGVIIFIIYGDEIYKKYRMMFLKLYSNL